MATVKARPTSQSNEGPHIEAKILRLFQGLFHPRKARLAILGSIRRADSQSMLGRLFSIHITLAVIEASRDWALLKPMCFFAPSCPK